MKKLITSIIIVLMVTTGAKVCRADYADMADQTQNIVEFWFGGYFSDINNSKITSEAEIQGVDGTDERVPSNKPAEYYSLENSPSGGFLYKTADLPNRLHLEVDFYNVDDWYGDFRYSYLDYVQVRLLPRRLYHNLDNITLHDFTPLAVLPNDSVIIDDAGIDDYGLTVDIDQYKLRFKIPGFAAHLYSEGEYILKEGDQQQRFIGGTAYHSRATRVTQSSEVDQEKKEFSLGANSHLGPIEFDLSRKWRKFESKTAPQIYGYGFVGTAYEVHNVVPKLEATTDTFKIHTSHSGRLFISGTYSEVDKTNEYSRAEASNKMGYGEMVWLPAGYISFTAKYRHQKNEAEAPATVDAYDENNVLTTYAVEPGVESTTETASFSARYSLIPKTNIRLQYINKRKEVEEESAIAWERPLKTTNQVYEFNLTNWAIPRTRITAKLKHTDIDQNFLDPILGNSVNNDPEVINQGTLGLAIMASPKVGIFLNGNVVREEGDYLRQVGIDENDHGESLRQAYVASLAFTVSEKLSFSPTYTFIRFEQERAIVWEDGAGAHITVPEGNTNEQTAHNFALNMMFDPTKKVSINAAIDYTTTEGTYDPTSPITLPSALVLNADEIGMLSGTDTEEINVRLDTDFDLGQGWGLGVGLRYTNWKDESFDNPSEGDFYGGLLKITKVIM